MTYQKGEVMPKRGPYAKDAECCYLGATLYAFPPRDAHEESKTYCRYELLMHKHTDTAINVVLKKVRWDRKVEVCETTIGFSELCNRILVGEHYMTEDYP